MVRRAILGVVCAAAAGLAFGQEFPQPGPEHERLKELLAGDWDAVMKMNGQETKATASYKSICGGMWLASDFEGDLGGLKFQGHGLDGYDQNKKKYVAVWVDSMSSAPLRMEGDYDADAKRLTMTGESVDLSGNPQKFKTTSEWKDKDHFTFKMYMLRPDGTGGDEPAFTIEYARRK